MTVRYVVTEIKRRAEDRKLALKDVPLSILTRPGVEYRGKLKAGIGDNFLLLETDDGVDVYLLPDQIVAIRPYWASLAKK